MQMISCSCTNHSSTLVLISSKSNYVLVPQMGSTSIQTSPRIKLLMQNPRKWTPKHVDAAKTKVIENARAEDLFGLDLIPSDGDPEFEEFANVFCELSREQIEEGDIWGLYDKYHGAQRALVSIFRNLRNSAIEASSRPSNLLLQDLTRHIKLMTRAGKGLYLVTEKNVPFILRQLNIKGKLHSEGVVVGFDSNSDPSLGIPLAILSVIKGEGNDAISKHEVPQALVPIITAYSGNPSLDQYDGFVVGLEGTHMHISRAIASPAYLDSLCQGTSSSEELLLYRSRLFDLFDCMGRRNFARFMIALFRHLARSEQSKISGDYPERIL